MKRLISTVAIAITIWFPTINADHSKHGLPPLTTMPTAQAQALLASGEAYLIWREWEDGSAVFTWGHKVYASCIQPELGCTIDGALDSMMAAAQL